MIVRRAVLSDISAMAEIEKQWPEYDSWGYNGLKAELEKKFSVFLIAEEEKEICGFINFWILAPEIEINTLIVDKSKLRRAVATKLLDKTLEYARKNKCAELILEVNEKNQPAISLYKKYGFVAFSKRVKYYNSMYDAIVMKKTLEL